MAYRRVETVRIANCSSSSTTICYVPLWYWTRHDHLQSALRALPNKPSLHSLDSNYPRPSLCMVLWHGQRQQASLQLRRDLVSFDLDRQREDALEEAKTPLADQQMRES